MIWETKEHGRLQCTLHGFTEDGRVIIHVPDKFDPGVVELKVPRDQIEGLAAEQTMIAVKWSTRKL